MSKFETLPNEILLTIFEFIDDIYLIRKFMGLNQRFDSLLNFYLKTYNFDFRSIYIKDFVVICENYLQTVPDKVESLKFSDDNDDNNADESRQLDIFFSLFSSFNQFRELRSLSLFDLQYPYKINEMIASLRYLQHLTISICYMRRNLLNTAELIDIIWNLPELVYCNLQNVLTYEDFVLGPSIKSLSIEKLIVDNCVCWNKFERLIEYTPNLQNASMSICTFDFFNEFAFDFCLLNELKLQYHGSLNGFVNILKVLRNLSSLFVQTDTFLLNGIQWEEILDKYLNKLKKFQFLIEFHFSDSFYIEDRIDKLLETFKTQFWLYHHRWFVQCHWNASVKNETVSIYTIPYYLNYFTYESGLKYKSTYSDREIKNTFNRVRDLYYDQVMPNDNDTPPVVYFSNVRNLYIGFPLDEQFWLILSTVNRLTSLFIGQFEDEKIYTQLQIILNRAYNLHSLIFNSSVFCPKYLFKLESSSISRVDFYETNYWFKEKCIQNLIHSPFLQRCEILYIKIRKRSMILQLIKKLKKLSLLFVQCHDDPYEIDENNLIEWLHHHLHFISGFSINRDNERRNIRISIS